MPQFHALIIEDDPFSAEVLGRLLKVADITYTVVLDAADVQQTLEGLAAVDLVFVDLEMPRIDGYQTLELLKDLLPPQVPVVAHTVHTNEIENAHATGFHSFIAKPLDGERFQEQLSRILAGKTVWEI